MKSEEFYACIPVLSNNVRYGIMYCKMALFAFVWTVEVASLLRRTTFESHTLINIGVLSLRTDVENVRKSLIINKASNNLSYKGEPQLSKRAVKQSTASAHQYISSCFWLWMVFQSDLKRFWSCLESKLTFRF